MKYVSLLKSFYPSFSKQEKKVADYMLLENKDLCFKSLQEISREISVSEATIVRLVKKMGYKGFIEFKLEVAKEEYKSETVSNEDFIENIANNAKETIENTKSLIIKQELEEAIELIKKSGKLYMFGIGSSSVAALEMQQRLMRYGKLGYCVNDGHFQVMYATNLTSKDVLIVFSLSGETKDLIDPIMIAKEKGASIITITNYRLSPIAKISDLVILTSSKETPLDGGNLISKISQLYIVDLLTTGYALTNKKEAKEIKENIATAISNKKINN